jgi:hypothetical protein
MLLVHNWIYMPQPTSDQESIHLFPYPEKVATHWSIPLITRRESSSSRRPKDQQQPGVARNIFGSEAGFLARPQQKTHEQNQLDLTACPHPRQTGITE